MKKIVAILLAITLMSALFIVPVHAHESDEVVPCAATYFCDYCGRAKIRKTETKKEYYDYPGCTNNAMTHKHYNLKTYEYYVCNYCDPNDKDGYVLISTSSNHCIYD